MVDLEKIRALVKEKGLSIKRLEQMAGIGNGAIRKWDRANPQLDTLEKVAKTLDTNISDLLIVEK